MASKTPISPKIIKKGNRKSPRHVPKVDTSQARSNIEVLRMCLQDLGWKECISGSSANSDIWWNSATFQEGNRKHLLATARINKFPGMCDLLCKTNLTRSLNVMQMLFPDEFDFYPKTWFLPEQREQFQDDVRSIHKKDRTRQRPLTTFIVKPSDGSEGAGIYLIQDPTCCSIMNRPHVVQKYIDRPLLVNDLKFDIRIYVLIFKLDPLEVLLYDEGLARFATVNYQAPSKKNLHETFMHLTNYSLNKRSANYKHALDEKQADASKRKMSLVWSQLGVLFTPSEIEQAKEMIKEMINKTVLAILPELRVQYAMQLATTRKQNRCFQIIGFDIILTDRLKPILLEVNANPSLRIDFDHVNESGKLVHDSSPIDEDIKKPLVMETLKLVMKDRRHRTPSEANDGIIIQGEKNTAQPPVEVHRKTNMKNAAKKCYDPPRSESDSDSSDSNSEELLEEEQQHQVFSNPANDSNLPALDESVTIIGSGNVVQPSKSEMLVNCGTSTANSTKSLQVIFPSMSPTKYEHMFLLEKIAFIYIEVVVKRGYKAMTNWPFRNLASICGIIDQSTTMSSIDILYAQIFYKCKQWDSQSPATGLHFSAFMEAFFLLSQRKYPTSGTLLESVIELVDFCLGQLDLHVEEST